MILFAVAVLFAVPVLWSVSVGAVREARRARGWDPRVGCQAWVAVPGAGGRLYRCCEEVFAGGDWCRRHAVAPARNARHLHPDAPLVDQDQAAGRALAQARIGVPLALLGVVGMAVAVVWTLQRTT